MKWHRRSVLARRSASHQGPLYHAGARVNGAEQYATRAKARSSDPPGAFDRPGSLCPGDGPVGRGEPQRGGRGFMGAHPGVILRYNFGASGDLQKQIEAGAPVDVFVSAAQRQMDELEKRGLLLSATRRIFARNVLVVVKPVDSKIDLARPT